MTKPNLQTLLQFQHQLHGLTLSTIDREGLPHCSFTPFIATDLFTYFIFVSQLATHTANLQHHPQTSILLLEAEATVTNLYARKRFTLSCMAKLIDRDEPMWSNTLDQFEEYFGSILHVLRLLPDFQLFRLQAEQGLWVTGFGKAFKVNKNPFQKPTSIEQPQENSNNDHRTNLDRQRVT
ncbi:MAG TPA: HugZ family protein [Gammaproteobacteria bacterium]|nr:HugZ family protein [Gammaproteobacteria bacterium]